MNDRTSSLVFLMGVQRRSSKAVWTAMNGKYQVNKQGILLIN